MDLKQHIKENHDNNLAEFARVVSTINRLVTYQQVQRWIKLGCVWHDGRVWAPKT